MTLFEFVQWCFRDNVSGFVTLFAGYLLISGIGEVIVKVFRRGDDNG